MKDEVAIRQMLYILQNMTPRGSIELYGRSKEIEVLEWVLAPEINLLSQDTIPVGAPEKETKE